MVATGSLFDLYPEFVEDDTRKDRKFGYQISEDFLNKRYNSLLPPHIIEGKTILDLGSSRLVLLVHGVCTITQNTTLV